MRTKSKLYFLTAPDYELPSHIDVQHRVITREAADIPMIMWPDGTWCFPANVYMLDLFHRGLSRKNRGGTLLTYATNISHLLRYVFQNKIDLARLTDNQFSLFIKLLQGERSASQPEVHARDANAVIAIGRNCLDFLASFGRLYQDESFIGPKGQICAEQKEFEVKQGRGRKGTIKLTRQYWYHRSFPIADPKNKRLPISTDALNKLRQIASEASGSIFQRKRRYVMLKLLEITGGRRSELAAITCDSVLKASKMNEPMLKLMTAKKRAAKEEYRYIPIASHDVAFLLEFIEINRRRIIRATCGHGNDDGYLLISETTGRKLRPNTITQEIATLSKAAGIKEKCCPHMFRHRFITKLFVALIEQHEFENTDSFRRALIDIESIKQKVQQWTGHTSLNSLDVYINLAFEEATHFKNTYNIVKTRNIIDSFKGTLKQLQAELETGSSSIEISTRLHKFIGAFEEDLDSTSDIVSPK
jgi:integrase